MILPLLPLSVWFCPTYAIVLPLRGEFHSGKVNPTAPPPVERFYGSLYHNYGFRPARPQDRWRGYISSLTSLPIRGGASPKRVVAASHAVMKRKVPTFLPLATSIIAVPAVGRSAKG